jgi:hypothetical protein
MEKITQEQIELRAAELKEKEGCEVKPIIYSPVDGEQVIGYLREPSVDVILYLGDTILAGNYSTGKEAALKDMLIVEASNPRILSRERKDARIYASACRDAANFAQPQVNEYKKK